MTKLKKIPVTQEGQSTSFGSFTLEEMIEDQKILMDAVNALCPTLELENREMAEVFLKLIAAYYRDGTMQYYRKKVQSYYCSCETWTIQSAYYLDTKNRYWYIHYDNALDNLPF